MSCGVQAEEEKEEATASSVADDVAEELGVEKDTMVAAVAESAVCEPSLL